MPKAKVKAVKVKAVREPEVSASVAGLAEAEAFLQEAENVRTFLNTYDVHRSSQLDNLIVRAKADVDAKRAV